MKILHFSDTHLGFNDLDVINENNINQREADFYDAFSQVVDQIKVIKPDFIIHTGDLFHRASPSNRAITFALEKFNEINSLDKGFLYFRYSSSDTFWVSSFSSIFPLLRLFPLIK